MSVTATFTRNSIAYKEDGTPVRAGVPRFEEGKFGQAVLGEAGTENKIATPTTFAGWARLDGGAVLDNDGSFYPSQAKFARVTTTAWGFQSNSIPAANGQTWSVSYIARRGTGDGEPCAAIMIMNASNTHVSNISPTFSSRNIGSGWVRYEATFTINRADTGYICLRFYVTATNGGYHDFTLPQLEQKPYATSFIDGTRSPETLTIPTAGVLNPQEGTVACWVKLSHLNPNDYNAFFTSGDAGAPDPRILIMREFEGGDVNKIRVWDGDGSSEAILTSVTTLQAGIWYYVAFTWSPSGRKLYVNGVLEASNTRSNNLGFATLAKIGSWLSRGYLNGLIDDLRIDNIARSDAEILAAYQSGQPLQRDQYTTCLLTFDGTLRDKTRQFEVLSNTPSTGYISWSDLNIGYKGIFYNVADGSTNKKFAWWDYTQPYVLQTGDELPVLTNDDVLVFFNKNGAAVTVPMATVVDGSLIVPESIVADAIAANTITGEKIAANTISADNIAANAVGADAIVAGAIGTDHLAADAVTADKVAANAIGAAAIAAGAVVTEKLAANAVTSEKIHAGAVTTEKIGAKAVTAEKINVESLSAISSNIGHITAGQIDAGVVRIGPETTFAPGYDPTQITADSVGMGVDVDCTGLWHFDGSLNSHKGVPVESNADYNTGLFGQALNIATGKHLKVPAAGLSASQGTINFRAKNLAESANGSVLIDLPDSTNTEGLRVGISGDGKIYVEEIMDWVEEPDDFSQTETDFSTGTLNQVWQAEGGLQIATTTRTWNDFTGESWNDLA